LQYDPRLSDYLCPYCRRLTPDGDLIKGSCCGHKRSFTEKEKKGLLTLEHTGEEIFEHVVLVRFPADEPSEKFGRFLIGCRQWGGLKTQTFVIDGIHYALIALNSGEEVEDRVIRRLLDECSEHKVYSFPRKRLDCITREVLSQMGMQVPPSKEGEPTVHIFPWQRSDEPLIDPWTCSHCQLLMDDGRDKCTSCEKKMPVIDLEHVGREIFEHVVLIRFPDTQRTDAFCHHIQYYNHWEDLRTQILVIGGVHYVLVAMDSEEEVKYRGIKNLVDNRQDYRIYSFQRKKLDRITRDVLSRISRE